MGKMDAQLAGLIARNPENSYAVVIVCSANNNFQEMGLNKLMDNIYSGKLSGIEINKLALFDEVHSIELDKTITIE